MRHSPVYAQPRTPIAINWSSPQARGLHWYWNTAAARGANAVHERRGNHANWQGVPSWVADPERGMVLSFDGSDDYLSTTYQIYPTVFPISISAWFKTASSEGGCIVGHGNNQTGVSTGYEILLYLTDAGKIVWGYKSGSYACKSATGFNDGQWHHVIGTSNDTTGKQLFVDGVLVATHTNTAQSYQIGYWRIGHQTLQWWTEEPTSYFLNGRIDDVRFYNKTLTAPEAQHLYAPETRYDLWQPYRAWAVREPAAGGAVVNIAGEVAGVSAVSAALSVTREVAGQTDGVLAVTAAVSVTREVAGQVAGVSDMTAAVTIAGSVEVAGEVAAASTVMAAASVTREVAGAVEAETVVAGAITVTSVVSVTGEMASESDVAAVLSVARGVAGTISGQSIVTGTALLDYALAGVMAGVSALTCSLTVSGADAESPPFLPRGPSDYGDAMRIYLKLLEGEYGRLP